MSVYRNFSDYRRWVDIPDFRAALEEGRQMEQLWCRGFAPKLSQVLSVVDQGHWRGRLLPNFGDPGVWLAPEIQLWDRTVCGVPLSNFDGPNELDETFTKFTLWITVPRVMFGHMIQTLLAGQEFVFDQNTFPLGNMYPVNFLYSPRSSLLWFTFLFSIGQSQGAHFDESIMLGPVTLGLRIPMQTFLECGTSWNRYYTDFFTHFNPQLRVSFRLSPQLRGLVALRHDFDCNILVRLLNRIRQGSFQGLFMMMHLPVHEHHFNAAQASRVGGEPPRQTLLYAPRARL